MCLQGLLAGNNILDYVSSAAPLVIPDDPVQSLVQFLQRQVEVLNDDHDPRHHYLKGLEGCSTGLLAGVQSAFEDLYGLLSKLLDQSLRMGQVT